ncbi:MAG: DUF2004 domain-containing protein [Bacteroidetes bacterium]|nr:MAG: DUF2004 domain-containing protein [Bacteroidota bacterium]
MTIKYFEELNPAKLEGYYSNEIELQSGTVKIDLNFESETLSPEKAELLNSFLNQVQDIVDRSWQLILEDYKNGNDVQEFISFHLDDFFEDDPEVILEGTDPNLDNKDRFMQTLRVNRIGFYPEDDDNYMIIDWMSNPELSNYILVVNYNSKNELDYITVES